MTAEHGMNGPQDIYLCQVSDTVSCGACCGLYNLPDLMRDNLHRMLAARTEAFAAVPRTEDGIFLFKRIHRPPHRLSRPFPGFHHCPFLGLLGREKSRVGCLLHPEAPGNNNRDYRLMSWYGEEACRSYFCPSTRKMAPLYQSILRYVFDDWYLFGLLVTEYQLVHEYFREVESRLGRQVTVDDYRLNSCAVAAFREFAELRCSWPYRRADLSSPCNYFFENGLYPRTDTFRSSPDIPQSSYETILRELDSGFSSLEELRAAERLLDQLFSRTQAALRSHEIPSG